MGETGARIIGTAITFVLFAFCYWLFGAHNKTWIAIGFGFFIVLLIYYPQIKQFILSLRRD